MISTKVGKRTLLCIGLATALLSAALAPAEAATQQEPPQTCDNYTAPQGWDWVCLNGTVTRQKDDQVVTETLEDEDYPTSTDGSPTRSQGPLQRILNSYTSLSTEYLRGSLSGKFFEVPVTLKVTLYNHSPKILVRYSASPAKGVTFKVRIQQDLSWQRDKTRFTYPGRKGSAAVQPMWSWTEDPYDVGHRQLPFDGGKYFIDLYDIRISNGRKSISPVGSVQSDRMICPKKAVCRFR